MNDDDVDLVIVASAQNPGEWVVLNAGSSAVLGNRATQRDAVALARELLSGHGGGRVAIFANGSGARRIVTLRPVASAERTVPEARGRGAGVDIDDVVDGAGAAAFRVQGESFDPDGDGEADGDRALDGVLLGGRDTESKRAYRGASAWMDVVLIAAGFVGALVGVPLVAPWIGGGVVGVALSTLALSAGAAFAFVIFRTASLKADSRSDLVLGAVVLAGSFFASTLLATVFGQPAPDLANPHFTEWIEAAFRYGPLDIRIVFGALAIVAFVFLGAAQIYGFLGALLSIACGLLIAWRVADLISPTPAVRR